MAFTTSDYTTLTQKLNNVFNETMVQELEGVIGKQIYQFVNTDWQVWNDLILNAVPGISGIAEGQELPTVSSAEGDSKSVTQKRFGAKVSVTKDMRKFERYDQMQSLVKSSVTTSLNKLDQSLADLMLNGFSSTAYVDVFGYSQATTSSDGVALFSASHTNNINSNTARNLIRDNAANGSTVNPTLARDPVFQAISDALNYKDPQGNNMPVHLDTMYVSPTNADLAERIVYSTGVATTPNVDVNPIKGRVKNVYVWSKLTTSGQGTDTSAYWFMCDSKLSENSLKAVFAQPIQMQEAENVTETQNWLYPIDAYFTIGAFWPFGVWGSKGTNA